MMDSLLNKLGFWVLQKLGVFWLLKLLLAAIALLWLAKLLLGRGNPRAALLLLVLGLCGLEWAEPGHLTYGVPTSFPPTKSVVIFTIDDRTLPDWATWLKKQTTGQPPDPKITVDESEPAP